MTFRKQAALFALLAALGQPLGLLPVAHAEAVARETATGRVVDRESFQHYLDLFNRKDPAAFDTYYAPDVRMTNGGLVFNGIPEVRDHYRQIWGAMDEEVKVEQFLFDGKTLAVQLHTVFSVPRDAQQTPFGPIRQGERFDFHGAVFYTLNEAGKFTDIRIGYYSFSRTTSGVTHAMGMPH
ncbi:nuclear transport factor 2 family protein [Stutzerimonas chloritidismutans]|uniref:nuclear transport factor 2 family protein n=1 Tax=Stutzerimonas chloritidismutans TaxID=203192 RepID=UPI003F177EB2